MSIKLTRALIRPYRVLRDVSHWILFSKVNLIVIFSSVHYLSGSFRQSKRKATCDLRFFPRARTSFGYPDHSTQALLFFLLPPTQAGGYLYGVPRVNLYTTRSFLVCRSDSYTITMLPAIANKGFFYICSLLGSFNYSIIHIENEVDSCFI